MTELRVFIDPPCPDVPDRAEGGIRRVVEAQCKFLPEFGVRVVDDKRVADVTAGHGVMSPVIPDKPFVSHCHGLHWTDYHWADWAYDVNLRVTEAMVQAQVVTAPSKWVAAAVTRGMFVDPIVIYHGVDSDDWVPDEPGGYVFWDKARKDAISDPAPLNKLAELLPDVQFVSTLGKPTANVSLIGVMPIEQLKPVKQRASVYLATTRETMGIGTLEALAAGIPVAGWRYGGTAEIIVDGETGYLADWGDYAGLAACVRKCYAERARLGPNARADARTRWGWRDKIERYARVYQAAHSLATRPRPRVSVIVSCYNLGRYLPACLDSVLRQPFQDWECLIIDDWSTDDTPDVARRYSERDGRISVHRPPEHSGLVGVLNYGARASHGRYLVNLDADNLLPEDAFSACAQALDTNPDLHIAYGTLDLVDDTGSNRRRNNWPDGAFDWRGQCAHINQLHSSSMMRREVRERVGGYRERMWRAEDAEFWLRATSFGFRAQRVTDTPTLIYRMRGDSKSKSEPGDGPWNAWFPWAMAGDWQSGARMVEKGDQVTAPQLVPFGAQGARVGKPFWDVHHHQTPLVSVIIPVGPRHARYVIDALDSCVAQDFPYWEAIVINNSGAQWSKIPGAPYARVLNPSGQVMQVGAARNLGVKESRGQLVYFLDADDWMLPTCLNKMVRAYLKSDTGYIYTDYMEMTDSRSWKPYEVKEYDQHDWKSPHAVNILIARADFNRIGRFVDGLVGWEDWEFYARCAVNGVCGRRLAEPLFAYRKFTGTRRDESLKLEDDLLGLFKTTWGPYYDGEKAMTSCCGGDAGALIAAKQTIEMLDRASTDGGYSMPLPKTTHTQRSGITPTRQRMEYVGDNFGSIPFFGVDGNTRIYHGGQDPMFKYTDVDPRDVAKLESTGRWRTIEMPVEASPVEPEPERPVEPEPPAVPTVLTATNGNGHGDPGAGVSDDGAPIDDIDALLATLPDAPVSRGEVAELAKIASTVQAKNGDRPS